MVRVGTVLYGYCNGYFGRGSYGDRRIEAIGSDWVVVREDDGIPDFASFSNPKIMEEYLEIWSHPQEE